MKVIKFPRADERKARAEATEPEHGKMYLGSFSFTCPCGASGTFEPKNMIFRSLELYCAKCGTPHKLVNPAFATPKPPKKA